MNTKVLQLENEQRKTVQDMLARLKHKAPTVWELTMRRNRPAGSLMGLGALGAVDWGDILDTIVTVKGGKEIQEDERKAAELELKIVREKTAAIEKQKKLEIQLQREKNAGVTIAQKAGIAKESVVDQLMEKPWAVPALIGLVTLFFRGRRRGR